MTKKVWLTFDDGPNELKTPTVLEVLKKNSITATFFMIGNVAAPNLHSAPTKNGFAAEGRMRRQRNHRRGDRGLDVMKWNIEAEDYFSKDHTKWVGLV